VQEGGVLEHAFREIEIECLPHFLPSHLEANISHLKIGDSLRIENLSYENIALLDDPHTVVAHVAHPRIEEAPAVKAEAAEAEPAEPEVIKARRAEEGESKEGKTKESKEK
jgi:large subunit ribosomal protein L25